MKEFVVNALLSLSMFVAGAGAGLMPSYVLQPSPVTAAAYNVGLMLLIIGLSTFCVTIASYVVPKILWPPRKWIAQLLNDPVHLARSDSTQWTTGRLQQVGDSFCLGLWKPSRTGKTGRMIDKILFKSGRRYNSADCPKRYEVTLIGENSFIPNWKERVQSRDDLENIIIQLERPMKVCSVIITVLEPPTPNHAWSVDDIEVREVRLFGRWWRANIK